MGLCTVGCERLGFRRAKRCSPAIYVISIDNPSEQGPPSDVDIPTEHHGECARRILSDSRTTRTPVRQSAQSTERATRA